MGFKTKRGQPQDDHVFSMEAMMKVARVAQSRSISITSLHIQSFFLPRPWQVS